MNIESLTGKKIPKILREIPHPPKKLFLNGVIPDTEIYLCVIGSRKYTPYGKACCEKIISGLKGFSITIVSGLALGIDGIAHESSLKAGLKTLAVVGSGLGDGVLYPRSHKNLAERIIRSGGGIISEFEENFKATVWSFPQRNRIMAGLSQATLVIEAEKPSGTMITARLALDYNREVMAVPGSIFSKNSEGANWLIKEGATPIATSEDLIQFFNLQNSNADTEPDLTTEEKIIIEKIKIPVSKSELIRVSKMEIDKILPLLSMMEIKGLIKEFEGKIFLV